MLSTATSAPRPWAIFDDRLDVAELQGRVRGRLEVDELRLGAHRLLDVRDVGGVDEAAGHAEAGVLLLEDHPARAVEGVGADDVRSRSEEGEVDRVDGRHARRRGERAAAPLQLRDALLEGRDRGVAEARVLVAGVRAPEAGGPFVRVLERERRGLVDRRRDGAGEGARALSGVDDPAGETQVLDVGHLRDTSAGLAAARIPRRPARHPSTRHAPFPALTSPPPPPTKPVGLSPERAAPARAPGSGACASWRASSS